QAQHLFALMDNVSYHRLDTALEPEAEDMDNARPGNIILLNGAADRIIRDNTVLLDELADLLKAQVDAAEPDAQGADMVHAA
ncbi:MAG: patatin, partial [Pseudomonadota bacterium]